MLILSAGQHPHTERVIAFVKRHLRRRQLPATQRHRQCVTVCPHHPANTVAAQVATLEFIGSTVMVFLDAANGFVLQAQTSLRDLEAAPLAVGDEVLAHWSPRDGYFLDP